MLRAIIALCLISSLSGLQYDFVAPKTTCGSMTSPSSLIQGGYRSDREMFPWLVNIFTRYSDVWLFAGSGSLISERVILCAANSVAYENYLDDSLDLNPEQVSQLKLFLANTEMTSDFIS